jgi:hypothetical protein
MYIMRRTQLSLDDNLWNALHTHARNRKTSISELVRQVVRERYLGNRDERMKAMQEFVGIRKQTASPAAVDYVQSLRRDSRLDPSRPGSQSMTVLVDSDILIEVSRGKMPADRLSRDAFDANLKAS